jgi:hypothetical protein
MREYQVQGLNWMISLFENGINGILADEMVSDHIIFVLFSVLTKGTSSLRRVLGKHYKRSHSWAT